MTEDIELPEDCFACEHSILCGSAGDFCLLTGKSITLIQDELDKDCPFISDTFLLTDISIKGKIKMISAKELRAKYSSRSKIYVEYCTKILVAGKKGLTKVTIISCDNFLDDVNIKKLEHLGYTVLIRPHACYDLIPKTITYTISW